MPFFLRTVRMSSRAQSELLKASNHDSTPGVKFSEGYLVLVLRYISPMAGDGCGCGQQYCQGASLTFTLQFISSNRHCQQSCFGPACNGCRTAFLLKPPSAPGGSWSETILYRFTATGAGGGPNGVVFGSNGTPFELSPHSPKGYAPHWCWDTGA